MCPMADVPDPSEPAECFLDRASTIAEELTIVEELDQERLS
jgi:hypothetical protein